MYSMSLVAWEMKIETTMRWFTVGNYNVNHYETTRQGKILKSEIIIFSRGFWVIGTHTLLVYKMVPPVWKTDSSL